MRYREEILSGFRGATSAIELMRLLRKRIADVEKPHVESRAALTTLLLIDRTISDLNEFLRLVNDTNN